MACLIMNFKLLSSVFAAVLAFLAFRVLNKPLGTNHVQHIMSTDAVMGASKFSDPKVLAEVAKIRCVGFLHALGSSLGGMSVD